MWYLYLLLTLPNTCYRIRTRICQAIDQLNWFARCVTISRKVCQLRQIAQIVFLLHYILCIYVAYWRFYCLENVFVSHDKLIIVINSLRRDSTFIVNILDCWHALFLTKEFFVIRFVFKMYNKNLC